MFFFIPSNPSYKVVMKKNGERNDQNGGGKNNPIMIETIIKYQLLSRLTHNRTPQNWIFFCSKKGSALLWKWYRIVIFKKNKNAWQVIYKKGFGLDVCVCKEGVKIYSTCKIWSGCFFISDSNFIVGRLGWQRLALESGGFWKFEECGWVIEWFRQISCLFRSVWKRIRTSDCVLFRNTPF